MLFWAWRDESKDLGKQDRIINLFENNKEIIAENRAHFENVHRSEVDAEEFERIQKEIEEYYDVAGDERARELNKVTNHLVGYNRIVPDTNQAVEDDVNNEFAADNVDDEYYEDEHGYHGAINNTCQVSMRGVETAMAVKAAKRLDDDEYRDLMVTLNKGQYIYLMNVLSMLKRGQVFYHYVTGDAGTGKSRLIKALRETMNRFYSKYEVVQSSSDNLLSVLLAAFTGKAAANIKGTTLHCAFSIQVHESKCKNLSKQTLDKVRKLYANLKLIIIDEISLCGSKLFRIVDHRLRQIFDESKVFGGIPMIVLGDRKSVV
jgi:nucleoside-triphosphatase THEP1